MMKNVVLMTLAVFFSVFAFAQDAADKINEANEAMQAEDYAKAFSLYDDAMKNLGDVQIEPTINYNIGFAAYKSDNFEGAHEYFDNAIEAGVNISKSWEYKALSYNKQDKYAEAVESYEKAIAASEGESESMVFNAAIAAYRGDMLDKAIELFGQSVDNNYRGETAIYYKAIALRKKGDDVAYKATLEKGAEMYPTDDKITSALANVYVSEGNEFYKKGVAVLSAANEKVNAGSLKTTDDAYLTEVEKAQEEFRAALEILEKAKELDPSNQNAQKLIEACSAVL
ncbi:MAG TPA: tetratricopeptide repeat protein [Tangfeifania sp.]|nr:tetratricopeptide repeat protein [Tangfeifania sp.]